MTKEQRKKLMITALIESTCADCKSEDCASDACEVLQALRIATIKPSISKPGIRELRISKGLSASYMANVIGCSLGNYYKKESGDLRFSLDEARAIAAVLGESIEACFFSD